MNDFSDRDVALFTEALHLPIDERRLYLERACGSDQELRQRVEALLETHDEVGDFLEHSPRQASTRARPHVSPGEKPGDRIGNYRLLQQIGEGGCGIVFLAQQEEPVRRKVALKVIKPGMDTKSVIARFEAERQVLALMDHPNIAKVFDAGATQNGRPYFVMELVHGVKITEYCDQNLLTTAQRLSLFVRVCQAVQHAHQKGIIHRDIKPSNILVTTANDGAAVPVVIDFGIAKATNNQQLTDKTFFTAFEMLIGTPAYMSPEQAALTNVQVDTRTDIYSLGVLLYELLTGSTPFDTAELSKAGLDEARRVIRDREPVRPSLRLNRMMRGALATLAQHRSSEPPTLIRSICGDLDWIAMKALEKDPTRRYETANGLALDVQRYLDNEPISARPPSKFYKLHKAILRNKLLFLSLSVIALLLVVSLVIVSASLAKERRSRRDAEVARSNAELATLKSQQTTSFLEDMLEGVGPSVARGRDTTILREMLDRTAERVGKAMTNQPEVEAELRGRLGKLYLEIGNYDQAAKMHRVALELYKRRFGPESPEAATALTDLGLALWKDRKLTESEAAHREALGIRRHLHGNIAPDVASSLYHLASVYRRQQKLSEAEALTREALEIRRNLFGNDHPEVADTLHNLCLVLGDEGKLTEAEATGREMLAIRRRLVPGDHLSVASALADVAWLGTLSGKLDESESLEKEALAIQRRLLTDEHPDVAKAMAFLGDILRKKGKLTESHAVLSEALLIERKLLREGHPDYVDTLRSLCWTLEAEGKWAEAEAARREALTFWRTQGETGAPRAMEELESLISVLVAQKKFDAAEQLLNQALTPTVVERPTSANLLLQRIDLMGRQGRWPEAAADAARVLEHQPTEHYHYHRLAALLAVTHDQDAYQKLCQKIVATFTNTTNPFVAERMAKDCLLSPNSGVDLQLVDKLADKAVTLGGGDDYLPFFQVAKAMSSYRLGRFPEAIEWAQKPLTSSQGYAESHAYAVLAMADWKLDKRQEAREMLAKGNALVPNISPVREAEDLGKSWVAWLFARIQLDEASALIQPGPGIDRNSPTQ